METPIKMDDLGGFPPIFGLTPKYYSIWQDPTNPWDLAPPGVGLVQGEITPGNSLSCLVFGWIWWLERSDVRKGRFPFTLDSLTSRQRQIHLQLQIFNPGNICIVFPTIRGVRQGWGPPIPTWAPGKWEIPKNKPYITWVFMGYNP